jgi:hypothetical protein
MLQRCTNPDHKSFHRYGARGITVCERWLDYENFISDMGPKPPGRYSLERINNDLGYSPKNCKWATDVEQANNRRARIDVEVLRERMRTVQKIGIAKKKSLKKIYVDNRMYASTSTQGMASEPLIS